MNIFLPHSIICFLIYFISFNVQIFYFPIADNENNLNSSSTIVGRKSAPWNFGESALIPGEVRPERTATVRAVGPVRLLALRYSTFCELKENNVIDNANSRQIEKKMLETQAHYQQVNAQRDWSLNNQTLNTDVTQEATPTNVTAEEKLKETDMTTTENNGK